MLTFSITSRDLSIEVRVNSVVFAWRTLYRVLDWGLVVGLAGWVLRLLAMICRRPIAEGFLALIERRLVVSGWPHQSPGWTNLHLSRFIWRVRLQLMHRRKAPKSFQETSHTPLRIGFVGHLSGLLGCPPELFQACPSNVELYIFDIEFQGRLASLEHAAAKYFPAKIADIFSESERVAPLAAAINDSNLDMLVNLEWRKPVYALLDGVTTPCIANYSFGSDLVYHEKIDVQLYWQPEADYLIRGSQLFCCTDERTVPFAHIREIRGFYDQRDMASLSMRPWREREPMIVFHGALNKLQEGAYLSSVFDLLVEDENLQFIYMGKDNDVALRYVTKRAKRAGVEGRVHYEGKFSFFRGEDGTIEDPGWAKMVSYLQRSRLAPDPWPMGGGSSRFEAYLAGTPSVHMGLRVDRASWRHRQHSVCELPCLLVPSGTAETIQEYLSLCRRCLYDEEFADKIATAQLNVAKLLCDPGPWWDELLEAYQEVSGSKLN